MKLFHTTCKDPHEYGCTRFYYSVPETGTSCRWFAIHFGPRTVRWYIQADVMTLKV